MSIRNAASIKTAVPIKAVVSIKPPVIKRVETTIKEWAIERAAEIKMASVVWMYGDAFRPQVNRFGTDPGIVITEFTDRAGFEITDTPDDGHLTAINEDFWIEKHFATSQEPAMCIVG